MDTKDIDFTPKNGFEAFLFIFFGMGFAFCAFWFFDSGANAIPPWSLGLTAIFWIISVAIYLILPGQVARRGLFNSLKINTGAILLLILIIGFVDLGNLVADSNIQTQEPIDVKKVFTIFVHFPLIFSFFLLISALVYKFNVLGFSDEQNSKQYDSESD